MNKPWFRHTAWALVVFVLSVLLWRIFIPNLTSFEAPGWDESDRAHDALVAFRGLVHFNPFPLIGQLIFFQTWGPLFTTFAQLPLALFGASAQSLTLVSFAGLTFAILGPFWFIKEKLGWFAAIATAVFTLFWLVSAPPFGPYFIVMELESWVIVGWLAIAVAGAIASVDLLVVGSWIIFAAKYQYYPVFFIAFAIYLVWNWRKKLIPIAREFFETKSAKVLACIVGLAILHVLIMKVAGPIYGKESWNQPRALRNPVLVAFIVGTVLLYLRRQMIFNSLVDRAWEDRFIKAFFWPATILLAFPWPNRWAGVMVTQSYQAEKKSVTEIVHLYATEIASSLQAPFVTFVLLLVFAFALIVGVSLKVFGSRRPTRFDFKSLPVFVALLIFVLAATLLFAVKNVQPRFAFVLFFAVPVGLFVYTIGLLRGKLRVIGALTMTIAFGSILILTSYFRPQAFFLGHLHGFTNRTYFEHTELYPLDRSLGELVKPLYKDHPLKIAIVQPELEWLWDRPMQLWPTTFELNEGIPVDSPVFFKDSPTVCDEVKLHTPDLVVRALENKWETIECK
jgi:hypothetical protein